MEEEKELLHHHENISDENILNKNNITKEKLLVYEKSSENVLVGMQMSYHIVPNGPLYYQITIMFLNLEVF